MVLVTRAEPGTQQPLDVIFTVVGQYVLESKDRSGIPDEMIDKSFCALEHAGQRTPCKRRRIDRTPSQGVDELLGCRQQGSEWRVREKAALRGWEGPTYLLI